jgi:succinoglycan biosynthesis transport protein ExoP
MTPQQQYLSIQRRALDVEDYIDILRRHTSWVLGPVFAGLVISCVVAFFMRNTYISKAVLRITPPQISETLVPSTVNQNMSDRVAQMQTSILSRTSLSELIQRPTLNLYRRERESKPMEDIIEQMRSRDVHITVMNVGGAGGRQATAFEIQFSYDDASKAMAVVQALISRFMEESVNLQNGQGKTTTDFFKDEIMQAKAELTRLEGEITAFRMQNSGHLPEDLQYNVQQLNVAQQQLQGLRDAMVRIGEEKLFMETNLTTLKAQRDDLDQMATTTFDPGGGANGFRQNERLGQLKNEVTQLESTLAAKRQFFLDDYPEIKQLKAMIDIRKQERDRLQAEEDAAAAKIKPTTKVTVANPQVRERMIENQGRIDEIMTSMRTKETDRLLRMKQEEELNNRIKDLEGKISSSPPNQQKYAALLREHSNAEQHYLDLQRRETMSTTYDEVGRHQAGERLEVLDNANLPLTPSAPNRWLICGIGIAAGLMVGVFLTGVKEVKDTSLKNLKDVRAYTQLPILSSIPLLENDLLVRRKRRLAYVGWSAAVIFGIVAMTGSMYYHYFLTS